MKVKQYCLARLPMMSETLSAVLVFRLCRGWSKSRSAEGTACGRHRPYHLHLGQPHVVQLTDNSHEAMIVRALQQIRPLRFNSTSTRVQRCLSSFKVIEHVVKCQHTRDRPAGAELGHENDLRLHVKQYLPYNNPSPQHGDVTLIGLHANGFAKELYEPLWEDLSSSLLASQGKRIRAIWIADIANQGQSGVFNERLLGPDPSWWDHSRDLMKLINQFQEEMPHPIVGIGHSMGGSQL